MPTAVMLRPLLGAVLRLFILISSVMTVVLVVGAYVPRGLQLTYLSRPDTAMGGGSVDIIAYDVRHGLRAALLSSLPSEPQGMSWSPDGAVLAFYPHPSPDTIAFYTPKTHSLRTFYVSAPFLNTTERIAWSPDGTHVALVADLPSQLVVLDTQTGTIEQRFVSTEYFADAMWSPVDTNLLALRVGNDVRLWNLTTDESEFIANATSFTWARDGAYIIAYNANANTISAAVPGEPSQTVPIPPLPEAASVAWAPGGGAFLLEAVLTNTFDIVLYDVNRGTQSTLAGWRTYEGQPAWAPNGRWIAYVVTLNGHDNIMLYDTRRSARFRLRQTTARDWAPVWRPGG